MATHKTKVVEYDRLETIMKNLYNFFLRKACNPEDKELQLLEDLIYNIVLFSYLSGRCLA